MDFAEQVKGQVDLVRTVGEYVRLRRMGARWVGLCPFHTEKTPSFSVTPALGIYKCFGCGVGGDVIKFVQEVEHLTFWEALKALAERNGIPLPPREKPDADTELRAALFDMYEAAARFYHENLFGNPGDNAREYLSRRGLNASTAQQFQLGYAEPGWDALLRRIGRSYSPVQLEASGLFGKRDDGGFYDRFRGRLIFPIHNESGRIIAFGGRALSADDEPKYLNSPETPIYRKSSVLYNLHRARQAIRKADRTVLVEGYMDVIGVYAAGVHNVVASCGTALTPAQVRNMKRHSETIVVNFDPDPAGANATERSLQILLDEGMHVRVLELEAGLDPDEFIRKYGAEAYSAKLVQATGYFIWLADRARQKFGAATAEHRMSGYEALLLPAIRRISDRLERAAVATEVAAYLGLDRELVLAEFRRMGGAGRTPEKARQQEIPARERVLLRSLLLNEETRFLFDFLVRSPSASRFQIWPLFTTMIAIYQEAPGFGFAAVEARLDEEQKRVLNSVVFADKSGEVFTAEQALRFAQQLEAEDFDLACSEIKQRIQQALKSGDMAEGLRLTREFDEMKRAGRMTSG